MGGFYAHSTGNSGKRNVVFASKNAIKKRVRQFSLSFKNPSYDLYASAICVWGWHLCSWVTPNHIPGQVGAAERKHSILLLTTGSKEIGWIRNSSFASSCINGTLKQRWSFVSWKPGVLPMKLLSTGQVDSFTFSKKKTCSMFDVCVVCVVDEVHFC